MSLDLLVIYLLKAAKHKLKHISDQRTNMCTINYAYTLQTVLDRRSRSDRPRHCVTTPTRSELRHCRLPRPRQYYYGRQSILIGRRSKYSCSTHIFALALTYELDLQSPTSSGHHP